MLWWCGDDDGDDGGDGGDDGDFDHKCRLSVCITNT
jgi:hypothetical protein